MELHGLKCHFATIVDVGCFSHTLDLAGDKFSTFHLSSFCMIGCSYGKSLDGNSSAVCGLYTRNASVTQGPPVAWMPLKVPNHGPLTAQECTRGRKIPGPPGTRMPTHTMHFRNIIHGLLHLSLESGSWSMYVFYTPD